MKYIDNKTLEILTALIIKNQKLEVKTSWLRSSTKDFFKYITQIGIFDFIAFQEKEDNMLIRLDDKIGLKTFLQNYLEQYKNGTLEPDQDLNYLSYKNNLSKMKEVLFFFSQGYEQKSFILDSVTLRNVFKETNIGDNKLRFLEFILDLYFANKEEYIKITECKLKEIGLIGAYSLKIGITLFAQPNKIIDLIENSTLNGSKVSPLNKSIKLTAKQIQILKLLKGENSQKEIARILNISSSTVKGHLESIKSNLSVNTTASAIVKSIELKLI